MRTFESDLYRREKQLTELILKNERFDKALSSKFFSPEDTDILSNLLPAQNHSSGGIDFDKSGGNYFENNTPGGRGQNIDQLLN